jgi:hypothetical protein
MQLKRAFLSADQAAILPPRRTASAAVVVALTVLLAGCFWSNSPVPPLPGPSCGIVQRPVVRAINPDSGPARGGTRVTITGGCFAMGARVLFGTSAAAAVMVNSTIKITATSPRGRGTVNVTVKTSIGSSAREPGDQFHYNPPSGSGGVSQGPSS